MVSVETNVGVPVDGLNVGVAPDGNPKTVSETGAAVPETSVTVTV